MTGAAGTYVLDTNRAACSRMSPFDPWGAYYGGEPPKFVHCYSGLLEGQITSPPAIPVGTFCELSSRADFFTIHLVSLRTDPPRGPGRLPVEAVSDFKGLGAGEATAYEAGSTGTSCRGSSLAGAAASQKTPAGVSGGDFLWPKVATKRCVALQTCVIREARLEWRFLPFVGDAAHTAPAGPAGGAFLLGMPGSPSRFSRSASAFVKGPISLPALGRELIQPFFSPRSLRFAPFPTPQTRMEKRCRARLKRSGFSGGLRFGDGAACGIQIYPKPFPAHPAMPKQGVGVGFNRLRLGGVALGGKLADEFSPFTNGVGKLNFPQALGQVLGIADLTPPAGRADHIDAWHGWLSRCCVNLHAARVHGFAQKIAGKPAHAPPPFSVQHVFQRLRLFGRQHDVNFNLFFAHAPRYRRSSQHRQFPLDVKFGTSYLTNSTQTRGSLA